MDNLESIFNNQTLNELFPTQRTDDFFEALFGDPEEGSYDIKLSFSGFDSGTNSLLFSLDLHERSGCCLACNLTYGLPEVFSRHPIINIKGLVAEIEQKLEGKASCTAWRLGTTLQQSRNLHSIPLSIQVT